MFRLRQQSTFAGQLSVLVAVVVCVGLPPRMTAAADTIAVVATVPDLASLATEIGGDHVSTTVITKGPEDPHFAEPKPSFVTALSRADAFIQTGFDLEIGYAPTLLNNARNGNVLPGSAGFIDASLAIAPLEVRQGRVDRSMGDVHVFGNPHYLLDPVRGLQVAAVLRDRFTQLRPELKAELQQRYDDFRRRLLEALVGAELAAKYDGEKLAVLHERGKLDDFLRSQGDEGKLGGWLGRVHPFRGTKVVDDHRIWPYFTQRFGFEIFGDMEPVPGVPPTTRHLTELVQRMQAAGVRIVLASPYYDPRHSRFISDATGARVVPMAHQVGSRSGTQDYLSMVDYNVRQIVAALEGAGA